MAAGRPHRPGVQGRPASVAQRRDGLPVAGQVGGDGVLGRLAGGDAGGQQGAEGPLVQVRPRRCGKVVVHCLPQQRVAEPQPALVVLAEQIGADEVLDDADRPLGGQLRQRRSDRRPELDAQHAGRPDVRLRGRVGRGEPGQQEPPARLAGSRAGIRRLGVRVRCGELQQQRVTVAGGHRPLDRLAAELAEPVPQHRPGRPAAQRGQPLDVRQSVRRELLGHPQRGVRPRPRGGNDRDRQPRCPAAEQVHQGQRVGVRPVQVIEREQQRPVRGLSAYPAQRGVIAAGRGQVAGPLAVRRLGVLAQRLPDQPVRQGGLHRISPADADVEPGPCLLYGGVQHTGLTQPGGGHHEHHAAVTGVRRIEQPPEGREGGVPLIHPGPHRRLHSPVAGTTQVSPDATGT